MSSSFSVFGLMGVVFVALKLMGYIAWPWIWVTLPFWGGIALALIVIGLFFAVGVKLVIR